jgi:hypothetical protein
MRMAAREDNKLCPQQQQHANGYCSGGGGDGDGAAGCGLVGNEDSGGPL